MPHPVLDASALLAYLGDEAGAEVVSEEIADGAVISTVNLAEVLSTLASHGADPERVVGDLFVRGLLAGAIAIEEFTHVDAIETARLRPLTSSAGLSLGDRACLALGRRLGATVLTADQAWVGLGVDVDVHAIRAQAS